jgi:hypothetical protein
VYEERFEKSYGFYRPYLRSVIHRYLDCGILRNGSAGVRWGECGHEYHLAFSCKRRNFSPSCHQKRVVEFEQWLCGQVLEKVPHRHFVFSIPKILLHYFLYDRLLPSELRRCAWEALTVFSERRFHKGVGSVACLRPSNRNVFCLLPSGNLQPILIERSEELVYSVSRGRKDPTPQRFLSQNHTCTQPPWLVGASFGKLAFEGPKDPYCIGVFPC